MAEEQRPVWDQEPYFVCWKVETWEHAALFPKSFGQTARLRDSQRLLPEEITAPIYAALAEEEEAIFRWTEPLPPLRARLLRDINSYLLRNGEGNDGSEASRPFGLPNPVARRFNDVVPDWGAKLAQELGARRAQVERDIHNFACLGIPRGDFSIWYGYRIYLNIIPGRYFRDPRAETHQSLLMGCSESLWQPGTMRDVSDSLMR